MAATDREVGTVGGGRRLAIRSQAICADGEHLLTAVATDLAGNVGTASATFTAVIDTSAPLPPTGLSLTPATDSGMSSTDGITNIANPTATGTAEGGALVTLFVNGQSVGQGTANSPWTIATGSLADGGYPLTASAEDLAGNISSTSAAYSIMIDTVAPSEPQFALSSTSNTESANDKQTTAARVTLVGQTEGRATVTLVERALNSLAALSGGFQIPGVSLVVGDNLLTAHAADLAGNTGTFQLTLHRLDQPTSTDPVLAWNQTLLEAIRRDATAPPVASRFMAMVHAAIYDAVAAIENKPSLFVALDAPVGTSAEAAVAAAAHRVLLYAYPAQKTAFDTALASSLAGIPDGQGKTDGLALGRATADAVIAIRSRDGWNDFEPYVGSTDVGAWRPTAPMFAPALLPQWATLEPFTLDSPSQFRPVAPPAITSVEYASAVTEVQLLGSATSTARTAEQTEIARFWADNGGTYTPPGHWNQIAAEVATAEGNSLADNARLFAELNLALADAAITAWDAKYAYGFLRPITAVREAGQDNNDGTIADRSWTPFLVSPPFPEYVSGHSTFSGAAAAILTDAFGTNVTFTTASLGMPGIERTFTSFTQAADEAGRSRIYGGIHFEFSNQVGLAAGRNVAAQVLDTFSFSTDMKAPVILVDNANGGAFADNVTLTGRVLDNLSGVASFESSLDGGAFAPLSFNAFGGFTHTTVLQVTGADDGAHTITLRATDAEGNVSTQLFSFILDTLPPSITITTPGEGTDLLAGARLEGTASGTGSSLTAMSYKIDSGAVMPLTVSATGSFATQIDLSRLATGDHTLTLSARDAAGHTITINRAVKLPALVPLAVASFLPLNNATEVGVTFRPKVNFTRPIDTSTLTHSNFYVSDAAGNVLPTTIVPANDGSFAWLFVRDPLPGAARVTVTVDGSSIRAADNSLLDADGDGTPGGTLRYSFNTVSRTNLDHTSITGILADPGPDLQPGTRDDVQSGADGVLMTADDVYLLPIAGAKIFILGREDQAVFTDADGRFTLNAIPVGNVKLAINGLTATNAPSGLYFPEMVMDLTVKPGIVNTVMQAMQTDSVKRAKSTNRASTCRDFNRRCYKPSTTTT